MIFLSYDSIIKTKRSGKEGMMMANDSEKKGFWQTVEEGKKEAARQQAEQKKQQTNK